MSANKCFITTSWDDGYPLDFKLCSLLKKYGLPATFYIPKTNSQYIVMSENQIRDISSEYEIGGHTLSHRKLTSLSLDESAAEIQGCKRWIEDTIGQSPKCFSPPGGFYNRKIAGQIFSAGFETMRTTTLLSLDKFRKNNNIIDTSILLFPHKKLTYYKHFTKRMMINSLFWFLNHNSENDLLYLTENLLTKLISEGGVLHVWGHSWEIEENSLWAITEEIFRLLSNINEVTYVSNGELVNQ